MTIAPDALKPPANSIGDPAIRVHIAGDHAAYELKEHLVGWLKRSGYEVVDHGPSIFDEQDDYPCYVLRAAEAVASDRGGLGVVLGGSGNGEQIAANKVAGVRAVLAWNEATAVLGRQHNDANAISIGARQHTVDEATRLVDLFLRTAYSGKPRHQRRIDMIWHYETTRELPPLPDVSAPEAESSSP